MEVVPEKNAKANGDTIKSKKKKHNRQNNSTAAVPASNASKLQQNSQKIEQLMDKMTLDNGSDILNLASTVSHETIESETIVNENADANTIGKQQSVPESEIVKLCNGTHSSNSQMETIEEVRTKPNTSSETCGNVTNVELATHGTNKSTNNVAAAAANGMEAKPSTITTTSLLPNELNVISLNSDSSNLYENAVIEYKVYENELQMPDIMRLIQKSLSEPYSIYTYRYFIHNWPKLCYLAMHGDVGVGAIVCKLDIHRNIIKRGYIAMLAVDDNYRKLKIGTNLVQKAIEVCHLFVPFNIIICSIREILGLAKVNFVVALNLVSFSFNLNTVSNFVMFSFLSRLPLLVAFYAELVS